MKSASLICALFLLLGGVFGGLLFTPLVSALQPVTVVWAEDGSDGTAPYSWTHDVPPTVNGFLLVGLMLDRVTEKIVSVTAVDGTNTLPLTPHARYILTDPAGDSHHQLWYLTNAQRFTSAFNIVVVISGPATLTFGSATFNNVDPASPILSSSTATATSTTPSVSLCGTGADNLAWDFLTVGGGTDGLTSPNRVPNAGQTPRWDELQPGAPRAIAGSSKPSVSGMMTLGWTLDTSEPWRQTAVELNNA